MESFSVKQETPEIFPDVEHLNNVVPPENNTTGTKQLRYFAWQLSLVGIFTRGVVHISNFSLLQQWPFYYMRQARKDERDISRSPKIVEQKKRARASECWIITAIVE